MDRIQVKIDGTAITLPTVDASGIIDLTGWTERGAGDKVYYWADPASTSGLALLPGVSLGFGSYNIAFDNGVYMSLEYLANYGEYENYISYAGMYNDDGTGIGTPVGSSGGGYDNLQIIGLVLHSGEFVYYGFALIKADDTDYMQAFLCNDAIYDGSTVEPYEEGPQAPTQGGWGSWDRSTDQVGVSPIPANVMPFGNGVNMYKINAAAFHSFSSFLWGSDESLWTALWGRYTNFKYNPVGCIIACFALPDEFIPSGTSTTRIAIAGTSLHPIGGTCQAVGTQFIDATYTLDIAEFYGDWMDYEQTRIVLHLPFIGTISIEPIYCVGGGISVTYRCDVSTGNVTAFVVCTNRDGRAECIYTANGNASYNVPVTGHDDGVVEMIGQNLQSIVSGVKTGAASLITGKVQGAAPSFVTPIGKETSTQIIGNHAGSGAITDQLTLYAELVYTEPSQPDYYTQLRGRPADIGGRVGDFSGFTIFSEVHADAIAGATDAEKLAIESALREGCYI